MQVFTMTLALPNSLSLCAQLCNCNRHSAMLKFVLSCLPASAKLIVEDPDEKQHVRALLRSMKNEVDAIKRHSKLSPDAITPALVKEIASLQCDTDGVASTLKRGWL